VNKLINFSNVLAEELVQYGSVVVVIRERGIWGSNELADLFEVLVEDVARQSHIEAHQEIVAVECSPVESRRAASLIFVVAASGWDISIITGNYKRETVIVEINNDGVVAVMPASTGNDQVVLDLNNVLMTLCEPA
jgi:hypothetical protein